MHIKWSEREMEEDITFLKLIGRDYRERIGFEQSRKRYPEYGSLDLRRECIKGNGRCKNECHENEVRIAYCIRPGTHCCLQT
ncbi:PREDICTED: beta-defensin 110-like [Propithecus coquereli]|uniref:beta-defensin 110-like n=1 Tax=Propithecus coquereli TaxID=379532 RepID=UPI00063FA64A|nr:PREDICTED: beta-defensin 110-like [Propithecus coquereli]